MPIIVTVLIIAAALFAAAFFYVSRIISTFPKGRAEEHLQGQDYTNKKLIIIWLKDKDYGAVKILALA